MHNRTESDRPLTELQLALEGSLLNLLLPFINYVCRRGKPREVFLLLIPGFFSIFESF